MLVAAAFGNKGEQKSCTWSHDWKIDIYIFVPGQAIPMEVMGGGIGQKKTFLIIICYRNGANVWCSVFGIKVGSTYKCLHKMTSQKKTERRK